jgi:Family of unknown function (DUF6677)
MAKTKIDAGLGDGSTIAIELKDRRLAAFLAWLVPGLGHIYQGRTGKGILFSVCILGTFFYGMYIGSGRVVYASTADVFSRKFFNDRWQYVCQIGVGLPAMPALVQRWRVRDHKAPLFGDNFERPPYDDKFSGPGMDLRSKDVSNPNKESVVISPDELSKWNYEQGELFDIGSVFTVIAGLLNVLVIFDAYGGPLIIPPPEEKQKADDKNKKA